MILFILILAIGLLFRLYYAFLSSLSISSDTATIGLMAMHILQGKIPIFFYGQEYMGPIESLVVAPFFKIFGVSSLSIFYAILFLFTLFIISTYFLTKEFCGSKRAGLIAIIYCAIPPYHLYVNTIVPLGYHVEILVFGNIIFILTLRIIYGNPNGFKRGLCYALIGLIGGVGFWNHYTMFYYLTAAGLFILLNEKIKRSIGYGFVSLCLFFIGGLPFWIYTFTHRFGTFGFPKSSITNIVPAIKKLFTIDLMELIGIKPPIFQNGQYVIIFIFAFAFLYFFYDVIKSKKYFSHKNSLILFHIIAITTFFGAYNWFAFAGSIWYVLPFYTAISIVFANLVDRLWNRFWFLGFVLIAVVLTFNVNGTLNFVKEEKQWIEKGKAQNESLLQFLESEKITRICGGGEEAYIPIFLSKEKIIYSGFRGAEYLPYDLEVDSADRVAIVNDGLLIDSVCKGYKESYGLYYDFIPFRYKVRVIPPNNWRGYSNYNHKWIHYAFDRNADYWWCSVETKKTGMYFTVDLGRAWDICRFDVINAEHHYNLPISCRIKVSLDRIKWKTVKSIKAADPLFWSGPRPYWQMEGGRWEVIFEPIKARYIKLIQIGEDYQHPWEINEIYIYEFLGYKINFAKDYIKNAKQVIGFIQNKGIRFVYTDFWLSAKIRKMNREKIGVLRPFNIFYPRQGNTFRMVNLSQDTGFVIYKEDMFEFENIIKEFGFPMEKKIFGMFICYYFSPWNGSYLEYLNNEKWLYWTGLGIVKKNLKDFSKLIYRYARTLEEKGNYEMARLYYEKAVKYYSRNNIALLALINLYKKQGLIGQYKRKIEIYRHRYIPKIKIEAIFKDGVKFLGYTINPVRKSFSNGVNERKFYPGESIRIKYFWELLNWQESNISVFVHFIKDGKIAFQGDYPFLGKYLRPVEPLAGEIFVDITFVNIPRDVEPGIYKIVIGLWNPQTGERVSLKVNKRIKEIKVGEVTI